MEYKVETSLYDFPAWQGGKDTLYTLIDRDDCQAVEELIETVFLDKDVTDEDINDFLWFERDTIAEHLGYTDWEAYETMADPTADDEEEFVDTNGTPIQIGDIVHWHYEAGEDEDGSMFEFKVVDEDGTGYFNIAYLDGDECPERWAWCGELEIID